MERGHKEQGGREQSWRDKELKVKYGHIPICFCGCYPGYRCIGVWQQESGKCGGEWTVQRCCVPDLSSNLPHNETVSSVRRYGPQLPPQVQGDLDLFSIVPRRAPPVICAGNHLEEVPAFCVWSLRRTPSSKDPNTRIGGTHSRAPRHRRVRHHRILGEFGTHRCPRVSSHPPRPACP